MRRTLTLVASSGLVLATVGLAAPAVSAAESVPGGGASFPAVFMQQCAADFNGSQNNFTVTYTSPGSGTGKGNFAKGPFLFGLSDRV